MKVADMKKFTCFLSCALAGLATGCNGQPAAKAPPESSSAASTAGAPAGTAAAPGTTTAARASGSPPRAGTAAASSWPGGFAAYPGARFLCRQHVTGAPGHGHIEWSAYATADPPEKVIAFCKSNLGEGKIEPGTGLLTIARPGGHSLSVHRRDDSYPRCEEQPAAAEQAVIIVSQLIR